MQKPPSSRPSFRTPCFFRPLLLLFLAFTFAVPVWGTVPLRKPPDWRSIDDDYSTGGAMLDLNGDGFLDLVTGNGNDMEQEPIRVNFNLGGMLEREPSWSSADVGYHCHIDLGDYDQDGDLDLAVALLGDPGTPQRDKIYENVGGAFSSLPVWTSGDLDNSFDLAWGDVDGDGDLDLAVACGETYTNKRQKSKVYFNNGGVIDTLAGWQTGPKDYTLDVAWGDVDRDGDLDLVCANEFGPNRLYRNGGSGLDTLPDWESDDTDNTLQIDLGDVDGDGWLDLAAAVNGQLGGPSHVVVYRNLGGTFETTASWVSADTVSRQYYSAVSFGDVDDDGDLDLASGGWWEHAVVFENLGGALETNPSFRYYFPGPGKALVVESTVWTDLDNSGSVTVIGEAHDGDGVKKVFYLNDCPVRWIDEIRVGGTPVLYKDYCYDFDEGWVALADAPPAGTGNVEIDYVYSRQLDLIVTNWDPDQYNIAFYHEVAVGVENGVPMATLLLPNRPNPFNPTTVIPFHLPHAGRVELGIYDLAGRLVRILQDGRADAGPHEMIWDGKDHRDRPVASGVYFYRLDGEGATEVRRMMLIR